MSKKHILLTRDAFRDAVFARDHHKCVFCGRPAEDAHHILERRLWGNCSVKQIVSPSKA